MLGKLQTAETEEKTALVGKDRQEPFFWLL